MLTNPRYFLFDIRMLVGEGTPVWQDDVSFIDAYTEVKELTLVSPYRLHSIFQYAHWANSIEGAFAQVGVYQGGSAKLIGGVKSPEKPFFVFDTFEGLPPTDKSVDFYDQGRFNDVSESDVRRLLGDLPGIEITRGTFPSSSSPAHAATKYAFVYLDVDIYKSNLDALEFFYPRLSPGGVIVIDDYGWTNTPGIFKSVQDFIRTLNRPIRPIVTAKYQCVLIKH